MRSSRSRNGSAVCEIGLPAAGVGVAGVDVATPAELPAVGVAGMLEEMGVGDEPRTVGVGVGVALSAAAVEAGTHPPPRAHTASTPSTTVRQFRTITPDLLTAHATRTGHIAEGGGTASASSACPDYRGN